MSDFNQPTQQEDFSQKQGTNSSPNMKDQLAKAGAEMQQRAGDALRASTDVAREKFKESADAAKDVASGAADQFKDKAREQQRAGSDFVNRLAGDIRDAARAFEADVPFAARGINSAADYVEDAAGKLRDGTFRDLVDGATTFARRQPAAFLGLSVLAGFAAVRFFKASENKAPSSEESEAS
jgi:gas vesicle protein